MADEQDQELKKRLSSYFDGQSSESKPPQPSTSSPSTPNQQPSTKPQPLFADQTPALPEAGADGRPVDQALRDAIAQAAARLGGPASGRPAPASSAPASGTTNDRVPPLSAAEPSPATSPEPTAVTPAQPPVLPNRPNATLTPASLPPTSIEQSTTRRHRFSPADLQQQAGAMLKDAHVFIGLDIGASAIKLVQLMKGRSGWTLSNVRVKAIPFELRGQEAERRRFVIAALADMVEAGACTGGKTTVALSGSGVSLNTIFVPKVGRRDLRSTITLELKKAVPFDLAQARWDYRVRGEVPDRTAPKLEVLAVAVQQSLVDEMVEVLQAVGLQPVGITTVPSALQNVVQQLGTEAGGEVSVVLEMGARASTIVFLREGMCQFAREIPVGGDHLVQALMRTVTTPTGRKDITLEEAETIKRTLGVPRRDAVESGVADITPSQVAAMLRPVLERLLTEIQRSFNYYRQTFKVQKVDRLLLSGGASRLKALPEFLTANLVDVRVELFDPLGAIQGWTDPRVAEQDLLEDMAPQLVVAFGLALDRSPNRFNFLPLEVKVQRKLDIAKLLLKVLIPVVVLIILGFYGTLAAQTVRYHTLFRNARMQLDTLEPTAQKIRVYDTMSQSLTERKNLLEKAVGRQPLWAGALKELSLITPDGIALTEVSLLPDTQPRQVRLKGEIYPTYTTVEVGFSQYQILLEDSPFFDAVRPVSMKRDPYSATPKASFELTCQLVY